MRISEILIALIIFSALISSMVYIAMDFISIYNVKGDTEQGGDITSIYEKVNTTMVRFDKLDSTLKIEEDMGTKLSNSTTTESTAQNSISRNVGATIGLAWDSFGIAESMVQSIANELGLPQFIIITAIAVILIVIITAIIYAIFKQA